MVGAMEHCGNRRQRVERLVSAWNQGPADVAEPADEPDDPLIAAAAEARRRARTRLIEEEVNAMRTARANGVSVAAPSPAAMAMSPRRDRGAFPRIIGFGADASIAPPRRVKRRSAEPT